VVLRERGRHAIGVVHPYSAHSCLLRLWLREHGLEPERDVQIVVVPPAQVHANLKAGHLDGYCVGEPWNSMAVLSRAGWCAATSLDLAPRHPEKVLMVRKTFAERMEREHLALIAAIFEACVFSERPANRERLIETLAQPEYIGAPIQALRMGMGGSFDYGHGRVEKMPGFHIFAGGDTNDPTAEKATWVIHHLIAAGLVPDPTLIDEERAPHWFRTDIHHQALALFSTTRQ
jgi:ABC-type nitrate/sulfonate/bicarbonate transport system substrate-binding protein